MRNHARLRRPSHATAVAYLALFAALGGGAVAASDLGRNAVGTKQLKRSAVTTAKIRNQAVTAKKVRRGALTGAQINASTIGRVPSAAHSDFATNAGALGGLPADAFARGPAHIIAARRKGEIGGPPVPLLEMPGVGTVTLRCTEAPALVLIYENTSPVRQVRSLLMTNSTGFTYMTAEPINSGKSNVFSGAVDAYKYELQVMSEETKPIVATVVITIRLLGSGFCEAFGQAVWGPAE